MYYPLINQNLYMKNEKELQTVNFWNSEYSNFFNIYYLFIAYDLLTVNFLYPYIFLNQLMKL